MADTTTLLPFRSPLAIAVALRAGAALLAGAGFDSATLEARLLLAKSLDRSADRLNLDAACIVPTEAFADLLARRLAHEPLALILGHREFWSLEFKVSRATLIPRPDSETLIEAALAARPARAAIARVLDLGTGTGCLLCAALSEYPDAWGVGIDRSPAAASLARRNAARLGLAGRVAILCADWAAPLDCADGARFDLVLCNPPYIPTADVPALMPDVAKHEPSSALDGGADGLDALRLILADLPRLLASDGLAVCEIGISQHQAALALAAAAGFPDVTLRHDLGGIPRALVLPR